MSLGYNSRRNPQSNFIPKNKSKSRDRNANDSDVLILQAKDSRKINQTQGDINVKSQR